jgi:DNA-binding SARP family transcriptional activator
VGQDVEFTILGPLEAARDGERLALGSPQMRAVLASLLLDVGRVVATDKLIDELWTHDPPATASNAVQVYVSRLRAVLGADALKTRPPGYILDVDPEAVDRVRFERLAVAGRQALRAGQAADAQTLLRDALALWRGRVLEDLTGPRVEAEASRLEQLRLAVLEDRIEADIAGGSSADAIPELEQLTAQHPLRERLWALQMRALYASGRQADALAAYEDVRKLLDVELGIEPGADLRELQRAILAQDPSLTIGRARVTDAPDAWLVIEGRPDVRLAGERMVIGRASQSDIVLDDGQVSGTHALLERVGAAWSVRDLGSRNGTFVNGSRVTGERVLRQQDELRVGATTLRFRGEVATDLTVGAEPPPPLTDAERLVLVEVCRLSPGDGWEPKAVAKALGMRQAEFVATLDRLFEAFVIPERPDRLTELASAALARSAVRLSDLS